MFLSVQADKRIGKGQVSQHTAQGKPAAKDFPAPSKPFQGLRHQVFDTQAIKQEGKQEVGGVLAIDQLAVDQPLKQGEHKQKKQYRHEPHLEQIPGKLPEKAGLFDMVQLIPVHNPEVRFEIKRIPHAKLVVQFQIIGTGVAGIQGGINGFSVF